MFSCISPGAVRARPESLEQAIALASEAGFGGIEVDAGDIADRIDQHGLQAVKDLFQSIRPGGALLPTNWRDDEATWREELKALPRLAQAVSALGEPRMATYIVSFSNDRNWDENYDFHVARLTPIAKILADCGVGFGLEFLGPKTLRESERFPFVHTMRAMLQMGRDIGPNAGLLLDAWHWHTSYATVADLEALRPEQVVYVHVNDAPAGIDTDEQMDDVRELPGATGVIDITGFLQALKKIGYAGPITPEPFLARLADLPSDAARCKEAADATNGILAAAGV